MITTTIESAPPASPTPPKAVFAACHLLAGVAALAVTCAVGMFFVIPEYQESERVGDGIAGATAASQLTTFSSLLIVFAVVCMVLAFLDYRGSASARVLTWVAGGLAGCFTVAVFLGGTFDTVSWYRTMIRVVAVSMLLLMTGAVVLLMVPASREYFRVSQLARRHTRPVPPPWAGRPAPPPPWVHHAPQTGPVRLPMAGTPGGQGQPPPGYAPPSRPMFENRPPVPKPRRTSALAIAGMILAALGMVAALYTFANIPNTTRVEIERSPTGAWTGTRVVRDTSYVIGYFTIPLVLSVLGSVLAVIGLARKSASTLSIVAGVFGIIGGSLGLLLSVLGLWANLI